MPEIVDAWRMSGDVDYLLHVVVADIASYDQFYRKLIAAVPLRNVSSRFSMERMKAAPLAGLKHGRPTRCNVIAHAWHKFRIFSLYQPSLNNFLVFCPPAIGGGHDNQSI